MSQTQKHRESSSRYELYQEDEEDQLGSKENYISGVTSPKAAIINKNSSESDRPKLARQGSAQDLVPIMEKDHKSVDTNSEEKETERKQFKMDSSSEEDSDEVDKNLNEHSSSGVPEAKKKSTTDYEDDEVYSADVSEDKTNRDNSSMMKTPV